jgi:hypothetical protein
MSATRNAPANQGGKPATDVVYHAMAVADVIATLQTSIDTGLSTEEANVRLIRFGPNLLPKAHGELRRDAG